MPHDKHRPLVTLRGGLWRIDCCTETRGDWFQDQNPAMTHATKHARTENYKAFIEAVSATVEQVADAWAVARPKLAA